MLVLLHLNITYSPVGKTVEPMGSQDNKLSMSSTPDHQNAERTLFHLPKIYVSFRYIHFILPNQSK